MIQKFYKFLCRHSIGVIRVLYLMPIIAVVPGLLNDTIFEVIILACVAVSLTLQIGNSCKWEQ